MTIKDEITLDIESLAYGGEGIARVEGKIYFVFGALPGEQVRARIVREMKNFSRAETVEILKPSKLRVKPPCPYFGRCGGCQLQHLAYEDGLKWKKKWLEDLIARIGGGVDVPVEEVVPSPRPYGYRNRVSLTVTRGKGGRLRQGFLSRDNQTLVDIDECPISMPNINEALSELSKKGRHFPFLAEFQGKLKLEIATDGERTFFLPWQTWAEKSGMGAGPEEGKILRKKIGGLILEFSPQVFFQVNHYLLGELVSCVSRMIGEARGETCLFDLFSGVGLFGLSLAREVQRVVCLEENRLAHQFALRNAKRNKIENALIYSGRVEQKFETLFEKHRSSKGENILLIDPPREGLSPDFISSLKTCRPSIHSLIYLSCEPSILARDLARLKEIRFAAARIAPFDLFPQTQIFETVVLLR